MAGTRRQAWLEVAIHVVLFWPAVLLLLPSIMRENDQASLLRGAVLLARGAVNPLHADFYNYDKQFGAYWLLGGVLRVFGFLDPVAVANIAQVVLLAVVLALVYRRAARSKALPRRLVLASLLSPVWILDVPFVSTAVVSACFFLLAYLGASVQRRSWRLALSGAAIFAAAACRVDVLLAVPFLIWITSPRQLRLQPIAMVYAVSAIVAFGMGRLIYSGSTFDTNSPSFVPQVIAAYTVFGLGVNAIVLLLLFIGLFVAMRAQRWRWFYAAGAVSLLMPLLFYVVQLFSPRYFLLASTTLLAVLLSSRGAALLRYLLRMRAPTEVVVALAAVVPLILGLRAPSLTLRSIRPTISAATVFPTAVGHWPMGAIYAFAGWARFGGEPLDHNQAIFISSMATSFAPACTDGRVAVLDTPMAAFVQLAVTLKHQTPRLVELPVETACGTAYADLRSLSHAWLNWQEQSGSDLRSELPNFELATPGYSENPLVLVGAGDSARTREIVQAFTDSFDGREFVLMADDAKPPAPSVPLSAGLEYAIASDAPPSIQLSCRGAQPTVQTRQVGAGLFVSLLQPGDQDGCTLSGANAVSGVMARTVLPNYMSRVGGE